MKSFNRTNGHAYLDFELFDAQFDQSILCPETKSVRINKSEGYVISIARTDKNKRLEAAAKKAKQLGLKHKVYCTSYNTSSKTTYAQDCINFIKELGSEVYLDRPHSEIMEALSRAEFLILSSINETFCHVAHEALQVGVKVMAYEVPPVMLGHEDMLIPWQ